VLLLVGALMVIRGIIWVIWSEERAYVTMLMTIMFVCLTGLDEDCFCG